MGVRSMACHYLAVGLTYKTVIAAEGLKVAKESKQAWLWVAEVDRTQLAG